MSPVSWFLAVVLPFDICVTSYYRHMTISHFSALLLLIYNTII